MCVSSVTVFSECCQRIRYIPIILNHHVLKSPTPSYMTYHTIPIMTQPLPGFTNTSSSCFCHKSLFYTVTPLVANLSVYLVYPMLVADLTKNFVPRVTLSKIQF